MQKLPAGRHSSLWSDGTKAFLRLARRKHRARGSLLRRTCQCQRRGATFCVTHRIAALNTSVGKRLSDRSPYEVLRDFRNDLGDLKVPDATKVGLKAFRGGKATSMAAEGDTLAAILECGEWRSTALLKYISETEIDRKRFLAQSL